MLPWLAGPGTEGFGNAGTLYWEGKQARRALEEARASLAQDVAASPAELVFTSGGTEADTAAITGIAGAVRAERGKARANHVICSAFEHHAALSAEQSLKAAGFEITELAPGRDGFVSPSSLERALREDTALVTIMLVQNELGTVQPVAELAELAHARGAFFHTDAVQGLGKVPIDVSALGVDAASFCAHKIGGPKGVGMMYLRSKTPFAPPQKGGGQEGGRRGGTQDVASAVGFAAAARLACGREAAARENARLTALRDRLAAELPRLDDRISLTVPVAPGDCSRHASGILHLLVEGKSSEMLVLLMDEAGFAVSGGSACTSTSMKPSHALLAIGVSQQKAQGALRVSLGWASSESDVDAFLGFVTG
jgi:cysteine desulfurase